jgi:hypothetical protein
MCRDVCFSRLSESDRIRGRQRGFASPLSSVLDWIDMLVEETMAISGYPSCFSQADFAKRSEPHFACSAAKRIAQDPGLRADAGYLQIEASAVGIHARHLELLQLCRGELIDGLSHPYPRSTHKRSAASGEWQRRPTNKESLWILAFQAGFRVVANTREHALGGHPFRLPLSASAIFGRRSKFV